MILLSSISWFNIVTKIGILSDSSNAINFRCIKDPNICMGTIAELYKDFGGKVFILGKPSTSIYLEATKNLKDIDKSKILAVGDSIYHDIKGANAFGIDSLLVTTGIHKSYFDDINPKWESNINKLKNTNIIPTYLSSKFQF